MRKLYTAPTLLIFFFSVTQAQTLRPEFPYTNGTVNAIAKSGNTYTLVAISLT
ncbi:MAG: hypothetical protein ACJ75F_09235 [Flavisolibacter sp.]